MNQKVLYKPHVDMSSARIENNLNKGLVLIINPSGLLMGIF